jgi:hypothetical protein
MPHLVVGDVTPDPDGIGLFGPPAVVAHANRATHTVHQPRRGRILDGHAERHAKSVPPKERRQRVDGVTSAEDSAISRRGTVADLAYDVPET